MKKLRHSLTGAAIIAAALATAACSAQKPNHQPDAGNTGMTGEFREEDNENAVVYGPPEDFDPADNQNEDVYGPPPDREQTDF